MTWGLSLFLSLAFQSQPVAIALFIFHSIHSFTFIFFHSQNILIITLLQFFWCMHAYNLIWYVFVVPFFSASFHCCVDFNKIRIYYYYYYSTIGFSFCQWAAFFFSFLLSIGFSLFCGHCVVYLCDHDFYSLEKDWKLVLSLPTQSKLPNRMNQIK